MNEKETGRLEAFSDGVFPVAITLLVLNIQIPGLDSPGKLLEDSASAQDPLMQRRTVQSHFA